MISKAVLLVALLCCVGCASVPSPTVLSVTPVAGLPTDTAQVVAAREPSATLTSAQDVGFARLAQSSLDQFLTDKGDPAVLYNTLARNVRRFLLTRVAATDVLQAHAAVSELESILNTLKLPDDVMPRVFVIPLKVVNGEPNELLGVSFVGLQGMPIVMLRREGSKFTVFPIETFGTFDAEGKRWAWLNDFTVLDFTGDGIKEVAFSYIHAGASNSRTELEILRWDSDSRILQPIFHGTLVSWAGDSTYRFVASERGNDLEFTFPWFGVFSAKMVDHLAATEMWKYDSATDQMARQSRVVEPPRSLRHQINLAEVLFRRGDLEGAQRAFAKAATDSNLKTEKWYQVEHAPRAFAHFRQSQALALLGREAEARQAMHEAAQAGGTVGRLALAFLKNYRGADAAILAWAMLPRELDLAAELYDADGKSNVDLPASAHEILFQGGVVAAYLQQHAIDAAALSKRFPEVGALGFQWRDAQILDWDGDGRNELLLVVKDGYKINKREVVWLVYRKAEQWRAREIFAGWNVENVQLLEPVRLATRSGLAVSIAWREDGVRREQRFAWDGARLQRLDLQSLEPLDVEENHFYVGWLPEQIEF